MKTTQIGSQEEDQEEIEEDKAPSSDSDKIDVQNGN